MNRNSRGSKEVRYQMRLTITSAPSRTAVALNDPGLVSLFRESQADAVSPPRCSEFDRHCRWQPCCLCVQEWSC